MKLVCMNCSHEFEGSISLDDLGWHSVCPECGSSFDVDVPEGKIKMLFQDTVTSETYHNFYRNDAVCSYYAFDTVAEFFAKWKEVSEDPDGMWHWVYDGSIADDNCVCSGCCMPEDMEIFMEYWKCDRNGSRGPQATAAMTKFKEETAKQIVNPCMFIGEIATNMVRFEARNIQAASATQNQGGRKE